MDNFINELFIDDCETSFISSGINDWAFGLNQIKDLIRAHWTNKHKYFYDIAFNMDDVTCTINGDVVVVSLTAESKMVFSDNQLYEDILNKMKSKFENTNAAKIDILELNLDISTILHETHYGTEYNWPFRVTTLMVKRSNIWLFKHINFSFGHGNYW